MIGKLEELTMLAVMRVGDQALPSAVYEIFRAGKQKAAFSAVYTTLGRLAVKGLLREETAIDTLGRERRAFTITGAGRTALKEALSASEQIGGFSFGGGHVPA